MAEWSGYYTVSREFEPLLCCFPGKETLAWLLTTGSRNGFEHDLHWEKMPVSQSNDNKLDIKLCAQLLTTFFDCYCSRPDLSELKEWSRWFIDVTYSPCHLQTSGFVTLVSIITVLRGQSLPMIRFCLCVLLDGGNIQQGDIHWMETEVMYYS